MTEQQADQYLDGQQPKGDEPGRPRCKPEAELSLAIARRGQDLVGRHDQCETEDGEQRCGRPTTQPEWATGAGRPGRPLGVWRAHDRLRARRFYSPETTRFEKVSVPRTSLMPCPLPA